MGRLSKRVEEADLAILRLEAPYEPRDGNFLERFFHAGDLAFKPDELAPHSGYPGEGAHDRGYLP